MPELTADGPIPEDPEWALSAKYANMPPSFGEYAGKVIGETSEMIGPALKRAMYEPEGAIPYLVRAGAAGAQAEFTGAIPPEEMLPADLSAVPSPKLTKAEATARHPAIAKAAPDLFSEGMPQGVVDALAQAKEGEIERQGVFQRYEQAHSWVTNFPTRMALTILDPVNAAAMLVPGIGEEAIFARLGAGAAARMAARGLAGATAGAAGMAGAIGVRYGLSQAEDGDYGLREAFLDLATGAAFGAMIHSGVGLLRERGYLRPDVLMRPPEAARAEAPAGEKRNIMLVRHGATEMNNDDVSVDRLRGWTDVPLSAQGREEAQRLGQKLKANPPSTILTSDLERAADTAKVISQATGAPIAEETQDFRPWNVGDLAGKKSSEGIPVLANYAEHKPGEAVPGGEAFNDFKKRFFTGLLDAIDNHEGTIAIVSHHRGERLLRAWEAAGFPENGDIDIKTFNQKGEHTGQVIPLEIPVGRLRAVVGERAPEAAAAGAGVPIGPKPAEVAAVANANPATSYAATKAAVAEIMDGRQVEVQPVLGGQPGGFEVYHGSPYEFDRFSLEHIGKGEGAQSYGHGLYFAEKPETAETYARNLAGRPVTIPADILAALRTIGYLGFDRPGQALNALRDNLRQGKDIKEGWDLDHPQDAAAVKTIAEYLAKPRPAENLYKARIMADPEQFLDWDKPASQQPSGLALAYQRAGMDLSGATDGADAIRQLETRLGSREAAAKALRDVGIPGIKYLDQGSRAGGEGTRNYVLFDDSLIRVTHRNGMEVAQEQADLHRAGYVPSMPQSELAAATEELYGRHKPTAIEREAAGAARPAGAAAPARPAAAAPEVEAIRAVPAAAPAGEAWAQSLNPEIRQVIAAPEVSEAIANPKIIRTGDVPDGAGYVTGGQTAIDRRIETQWNIEGHVFDPAVPANIHEQVEHFEMERRIAIQEQRLGRPLTATEMKLIYDDVHTNYATEAERAWVEAQGIPWKPYEEKWNGFLTETEHEAPKNAPAGLYLNVYSPEMQEKLRAAGAEETPAVAVPMAAPAVAPVAAEAAPKVAPEAVSVFGPLEVKTPELDRGLAEAEKEAGNLVLTPEDHAEIMVASAELDKATVIENAYAQAAECLTGVV